MGLGFACAVSALYWQLFRLTGHGAEWALVALLPLSGIFVQPILIAIIFGFGGAGEAAVLTNIILGPLVSGLFGMFPLVVLVFRLNMKKGHAS